MENNIFVALAYALPQQQWIHYAEVSAGSTIADVLHACAHGEPFATLDFSAHKIGIYGKLVSLQQEVQAGDRIEIYRPLIIDPMMARRLRAKQSNAAPKDN